jgi:hypothetical protein
MKRLVILLVLFALCASVFGQTTKVYEPRFMPQSAEIMAQGGSFSANAKGYYSLFTNPAAFGRTKMSLTIMSAMPWLYAFPEPSTIEALSGLGDDVYGSIDSLNEILTGPGIGGGLSAGMGFVGSNLGLGLATMADVFASGPNALGLEVDSHITFGFIGGFGMPLNIAGLTLHVGGSLKPMYRIRIPGLGIDEVASILGGVDDFANITIPALYGVGLGIDVGAIVERGPLSASLVLRDFGGTTFQYSTATIAQALEALQAGSLPGPDNGTPVEDVKYVIPMTASIGAALHPDLGPLARLIDPVVHAEYDLEFSKQAGSFWTSLHAGAEVKLLSLLKVRAGINQGYITAGAGIHLLFLDVNVAYFGRELGSFAGAKQGQGVTAEVALRF